MNVERFCRDLHLLHDQVVRNWGRIEITGGESEKDTCVLISRAELDCLERALEILCELPGGESFCKELTDIANRSTWRAPQVMAATMNDTSAGGEQAAQL